MRSVLVEEAQDGVEDAIGGKARETARLKVQEGVHEAPGLGVLPQRLPPQQPLGRK